MYRTMQIFVELTLLSYKVDLLEVALRNRRNVLFQTNAERRTENVMEIMDARPSAIFRLTAYSLYQWPQRIKTKKAKPNK